MTDNGSATRQRFAALFDRAPDAIILFGDDGRCVDANPAACALLAQARDELLDRTGGPFVPDRSTSQLRDELQALLAMGQLEGEASFASVTGDRRTVDYRVVGNILPGLHMTIMRDLTEARAAQTAQARLAAIVQHSGDAIMGLSLDGLFEDWNRAAEELYGYSAAEAIGRSPALLESPGREQEWDRLRSRLEQGEVIREYETVRRRKDRTEANVSLTLAPIRGPSGQVVGWAKIARDISKRKRAEKSFRDLLESAPDGVMLLDSSGTITLVNRQIERMFGYAREDLLGASIEALVPEGLPANHDARAPLPVRAGPPPPDASKELSARRKDGTEFVAEIALGSIDDDTSTVQTIAAIRDMTERNRLRDQLIVADRMASIGTLAAGVAHEINNPLTALVINLDLALQDVALQTRRAASADELHSELRDAREAAERVRQIVRDLKVFSRQEGEHRAPVDVRRVMESAVRLAWNEIRHRARLSKDYGTVPPVSANDSRLGQVFLNLLINAAQAIPEGSAESNEIRVATMCSPEGNVIVMVSDTGSGMTPEVLARLFTPFFTTKPAGLGTGLGLSICRRLISGFGGTITVESKVGHGTTFRIVLPPATMEAAPPPVAPTVSSASQRARILVIDDEPMIGQAIRRALGSEHDVTSATSARQALEKVASGERFDVLLCDLMMPQMTGMDFHAELSRTAPQQAARIIFLTAGGFTPSARAFLDQSPHPRVEKPFDIQHLRRLVNDRIR